MIANFQELSFIPLATIKKKKIISHDHWLSAVWHRIAGRQAKDAHYARLGMTLRLCVATTVRYNQALQLSAFIYI